MEAWLRVWRNGFAPLLPTRGLLALLYALKTDDSRLLQGATTSPPPLMRVESWPVEAADPVAFVFWQDRVIADGDTTIGDVEDAWARLMYDADQRLGEPASARYWINWWDDAPRGEARRLVIPEVMREIDRRWEAGERWKL